MKPKTPSWKRAGYKSRDEYNEHGRKYREENKNIFKRIENQPSRVYSRTKRECSVRRNIKWELSFNDFLELWQKPCTYCGDEIETIGIDRIESNKCYTKSNITPCCKICNYMKHVQTTEEFIEKCKIISSRFN